MTTRTVAERRALRMPRWLRGAVATTVAIGLALLPFTAVLTLGWLVRLMRRETLIALTMARHGGNRRTVIEALARDTGERCPSRLPGWWRGIGQTARDGLTATVGLGLVTLPYGALLLLSWWSGWENSFNKGYEQAWVGPTLAALGIGLGVMILHHLPMLFAHAAVEGRLSAFAEFGTVRQLIRAERWRYLGLTVATVLLAAPLLLLQVVTTFLPNVRPDLASVEALRAFAGLLHLLATVYLVLVVVALRLWAARLYARATVVVRPVSARLAMAALEAVPQPVGATRGRFGGVVAGVVSAACWMVFLAGGYVGQFINHAWWNWLNHPMIGLPWVFRVLG